MNNNIDKANIFELMQKYLPDLKLKDAKKAKNLIDKSSNIIISGHINADGDSLGSMIALYNGLASLGGKNINMVLDDQLPDYLSFLPNTDQIVQPNNISINPDLIIIVDCATLDRTGENWLKPYLKTAPVLIIDHHAFGNIKSETEIVVQEAAATTEIIYSLFNIWEIPFDYNIATALYAGLMSDTGGFRFLNTTPYTLRAASELLKFKLDQEEIRVNLFENFDYTQMKLLSIALQNMEQTDGNKLVVTHINKKDKENLGYKYNMSHGLANYTMLLTGVKVGVFIDEIEKKLVKVSLRSRRGYNIGEIAALFGGGGHAMAAGFLIDQPLEKVKKDLIEIIRKKVLYKAL